MSTIAILSEDEQSVYGNYRKALKRIRENSNGRNSRVGDRKQRALRMVSHRRNLPISEVKRIVRAGDAVNGISHEHPAGYLEELRLKNMLMEAQEAFTRNPHPCACGSTEMVRPRFNPYEAEICENYVIMTTCYMCYRGVALDI